LLVGFLVLAFLVADVVATSTWTGGGDALNWTDNANWVKNPNIGDDPTHPTNGGTIIITADASNTAGGNGIVSMNQGYSGGGTLRRDVNLNAGTLRIDAPFETGRSATFSIRNGGTVDLNGRYWMPNRHEGNNTYQIEVQTGGSLVDTAIAGGGKIVAYGEGDRNYTLTVAGGLVDVEEIETGKTNAETQREPRTITIDSGIVRVDRITRRGQGTLGTAVGVLNLNGGLFEIEGTVDPEDFNLGTINFRGGTFGLKTGSVVDFVSAENVNLDDDGGDDVTFDTTNGNITWNGILSGTGGLQVAGAGTFTLTGANTYAGGTTINSGTLLLAGAATLDRGGNLTVNSTGILEANGTALDVAVLNGDNNAAEIRNAASLTVQSGNYAGQIGGVITLTKTTAGTLTLSSALAYTGDTTIEDGTLAFTGAATLPTGSNLVVNGSGILEANGTALDVLTLNGNNNAAEIRNAATLTAQSGTYAGQINGTTSLIKTGAGILTLSGNNTYTGDTTVNDGTLTLSGTTSFTGNTTVNGGTLNLFGTTTYTGDTTINGGTVTLIGPTSYAGDTTVNGGTFDVDNGICVGRANGTFVVTGGTLDLAGSNLATMAPSPTLSFTLPAEATPGDHYVAPIAAQNLADLTLNLSGTYQYNKAFITQYAAVPSNLTVAQGTPLTIAVDYADLAAGKISVANTLTVDEGDLRVNLTGFGALTQSNFSFPLFESGTLVGHTTDWSTTKFQILEGNTTADAPEDYSLYYLLSNGDLLANFIKIGVIEGGTNPEAANAIRKGNPTPNSPTAAIQRSLILETDPVIVDQITQQFIPSMASANYAASVGNTSQVLLCTASQLTVPWERAENKRELVRGQNSYVQTFRTDQSRHRRNPNLWFQSFGNIGTQASKSGFAGYATESYGFVFGGDIKTKLRGWTFGGAYGYSNNQLRSNPWSWDTIQNPSNVTADNHTLLFYGLNTLSSRSFWTHKAGLTYGFVNGNRVTPETADGRFHYSYETGATTLFYQGTFAYNVVDLQYFSLTPKAKASLFYYNQAGYSETCAEGNFPVKVSSFNDAYIELDFLVDYRIWLSEVLVCTGSAGYRYVNGSQGAVLGIEADNVSYRAYGMQTATNVLVSDVGLDYRMSERLTLVGEYNYRLGDAGSDLHGGTMTLLLQF